MPTATHKTKDPMPTTILVAHLEGGTPGLAQAAIYVDLDRGPSTNNWAALVTRDKLNDLVAQTGATLWATNPWEGESFGDSAGYIWRSGIAVMVSQRDHLHYVAARLPEGMVALAAHKHAGH